MERDEQSGVSVHTMELTLYPQAEPRPALRYRLIPDDFDMVDGNAAIYYLKAMGFLEQNPARDKLSEFWKEADDRARREGKNYNQVAPWMWLDMTPQELPLDEVKQYLQLTSFQPQFLREATRRRIMDLDRHIRDVQDPVAYLLPEIQTIRELARAQSLRCKVAIAEGQIDDAIAILGQQYAMARHLGEDEFLVSNLVGAACAGIAWPDALQLVQHPETPNLYWAFASLPRPLISMQRSNAFERQFLYEQIKVLREVNETPRPAGYWCDFVDRLIPQLGSLASEFGLPQAGKDPETTRATVVAFIAAAYPGAKRYLIQRCTMPREQVEAYPITQTVALAVVRYHDQARDEYFKWTYLPFSQQDASGKPRRIDEALRSEADWAGWCSAPTDLFLPAMMAAQAAKARTQQTVALVQTVEAIRMYGAVHEEKLPATLDELPVPAPMEPFTGRPLDYEYHGDYAVLNGHQLPGLRYRLVLRFAQPPTP